MATATLEGTKIGKIETEFKCSCKLAPIETHKSEIFLGRSEEGLAVAFDADPRQMSFWTAPKPKETPQPQNPKTPNG